MCHSLILKSIRAAESLQLLTDAEKERLDAAFLLPGAAFTHSHVVVQGRCPLLGHHWPLLAQGSLVCPAGTPGPPVPRPAVWRHSVVPEVLLLHWGFAPEEEAAEHQGLDRQQSLNL